MPFRKPASLALVLWFFSVGVVAQPRTSPDDVSREYFAALQSEGLASAGRFLHPDSLAAFKDMMMPIFEAEARAGEGEARAMIFGQGVTIADVRSSEPAAFFRDFMKVVTAQFGDQTPKFDNLEIIGVLPEGEVRHVVARITVTAGPITAKQYEVLSFQPFESTWRLQLTGEMEGIAAALRQAMSE